MDVVALLFLWTVQVHIRDEVARFPDHQTTVAIRTHYDQSRKLIDGEMAILHGERFAAACQRRQWLIHAYAAWDALDDCHRLLDGRPADYRDCQRIADCLDRLRRIIGDAAYFAGEMP